MVSFLLEHKLTILIATEIMFWILASLALLLRYWFRMKKASFAVFIILIISQLAVLCIGILDYMIGGTLSQFHIVIIILLLYGLIFGKSDFQNLDRWIQRKVAQMKGEPIPDFSEAPQKHLYGKEHAKAERKRFYKHLLIFVIAHICFAIIGAVVNPNLAKPIADISNIWFKILIIDFLWSFSYTIFPKKEKVKN